MAFLPVSCKSDTKFVRSSYEIHANFVRNSSPKCLKDRYCECGCYEFGTNFVRSSNNLHEFVSFLCVCGCAWSEGLLFLWGWVHGVCVPGCVTVCRLCLLLLIDVCLMPAFRLCWYRCFAYCLLCLFCLLLLIGDCC